MITEKPADMTEWEWKCYQAVRDKSLRTVSMLGGRWWGSPWDITFNPHIRRGCNRLIRKGYLEADQAGYYRLSASLKSSNQKETEK